MTEFEAYLKLGFFHITDLKGFDHILFLIALCSIYQLKDWKKVLILVTAFTIGHSITLALATLTFFAYRADIVEFLIPVTILITAFGNFFNKPKSSFLDDEKPQRFRYVLAGFFGLIHGLGFSSYLRSLLGQGGGIVKQLLAFNIGLELGQLIIVLLFLIIATFLHAFLRITKYDWNLVISGIVTGMALMLILSSDYYTSITS